MFCTYFTCHEASGLFYVGKAKKANISAVHKVVQNTESAKKAHSEGNKRRYQDPKQRAITSEATRKSWIARRLKKAQNGNV